MRDTAWTVIVILKLFDIENWGCPPKSWEFSSRSRAANSLGMEAVEHALAAQEHDVASSLIKREAELLLGGGGITTLLRWLDEYPPDRQRADWSRTNRAPSSGRPTACAATTA